MAASAYYDDYCFGRRERGSKANVGFDSHPPPLIFNQGAGTPPHHTKDDVVQTNILSFYTEAHGPEEKADD